METFDNEPADEQERWFPVHDPDETAFEASADDVYSTEHLEQLYRQALQASDFVEEISQQLGLEPSNESVSLVEVPPAAPSVPVAFAPPQRAEVTPGRILEAALFVGGTTLTIKKLGRMLGEDRPDEFVENEIAALNDLYERQQRPYVIRFGEGGYRLALRPEFERIRNRVFGLGPKDVRLSRDALEVLALVAYRQPVSRGEIESQGKPNAGTILGQLLRRELVSIERGGAARKDVLYRTTPRFLQLFGLKGLDDLPLPDDLGFK